MSEIPPALRLASTLSTIRLTCVLVTGGGAVFDYFSSDPFSPWLWKGGLVAFLVTTFAIFWNDRRLD